eukprot:3187003-Rhodomonas_salina.1
MCWHAHLGFIGCGCVTGMGCGEADGMSVQASQEDLTTDTICARVALLSASVPPQELDDTLRLMK